MARAMRYSTQPMILRVQYCVAALISLSLTGGCDASDRSNSQTPGASSPLLDAGHRCEDITQSYPQGQATPSGMTSDVFSRGVLRTHEVVLSPYGQGDTATERRASLIPANTRATLTVEPYQEGTFSHIQSTYIPCKSPEGCADEQVVCLDSFSLPVRVRVSAPNGSIDESWVGALTGLDPSDPNLGDDQSQALQVRKIELLRPADSFLGAFEIPKPRLPSNYRISKESIYLKVNWRQGTFQDGVISTRIDYRSGSGSNAGRGYVGAPLVEITAAR